MFGWNIAKSAEAVFSRWAIKHVLKFLLKKKLGQFILGDLDLDQLDVQLGDGTIHLSDLALNVDYINHKLGASQVIVKEGSIGSLSIKIPWRVQNCQVEVEELELVLVPCTRNDFSSESETSNSTEDRSQLNTDGSEKLDHEAKNSTSSSISLDVHEGVKKIAKMVKWLLTSFHVKVKKLIVAYDPCSDKDERTSGWHRALVLRVTEIEYGTCVSEDAGGSSNAQAESFLGMTKLTNFVRFHGAMLELLRMDDVDNHTQTPCASGTTFIEWCMGGLPLDAVSQILSGECGGFSGNLKLSIPWKDGALDVHKVDADVFIDPLELRLQLNTIIWIIHLYQSLVDKDGQCDNQCKAADSVCNNSESQFHLCTPGSPMISKDQVISCENSSAGFFSIANQETRAHNVLLQESHVIPDWVPLSYVKQSGKVEDGSNLGASIDQFFECFDGLRSSQSALSNSGMWNLTCSVFSAITAASSLATGSLHIPSEQTHVETNFKAKVAGISISLFLDDEKPQYSCEFQDNLASGGQNIRHLEANFRDLLLVLQVRPHELKVDVKIKHIELDDYLNSKSEAAVSGFSGGDSGVCSQNLLLEQFQAQIQGTLPTCTLFQDPDSEKTISRSCGTDFQYQPASKGEILNDTGYKTFTNDSPAKIKLLKTSSITQCEATVYSSYLNGNLASSTSFSLNLPTCIVWLNFKLVTMLLDLFKQIGNSFELKNRNKCIGSGNVTKWHGPVCHEDESEGYCQCFTTLASKGSLKGTIFPSNTRVILCFPFNDNGSFEQYLYCNQFIGLDILNQQSEEKISDAYSREGGLQQSFYNKAAISIRLKIESLNIYLITSDRGDAVGQNSCSIGNSTYSSQDILSVTSGTDCFPGIGLFWQDDSETGPLIANMARNLTSSQDSTRSRNSVGSKGYEFASTTTLGDMKDINFHAWQEIILSSAFLLHICLPPICVKFGSLHYQLLCSIMNHVMDGLSSAPIDTNKTPGKNIQKKVASVSQTSVLVKCASIKFLINLDKFEDSKCSLQKELSGSWKNLKLQVEKLELLSVSNVGGVSGCTLFWLGHGEGELWGSVDEFPSNELLLISCSNSTVQRGDGEGTNALSLGSAGTEIVYLKDPQVFQKSTRITIKGSTIIAPGGRLDWFNALCSFFSLPDGENDQTCDDSGHKEFSDDGVSYGSSFVLSMVDIALGYEPHEKSVVGGDQTLESGSCVSANVAEDHRKKNIACLLASASLNLSNQILADTKDNDYKIRLQDLGLLICPWFGPKDARASYDVEYLSNTGFVKVAGEALVEAILRTNCKNGLQWELVCSNSHVNLDTCPDTTSGLINLAAQLQDIFAPDVQESVVHLQSRWKTVQEAQSKKDVINEINSNSGSASYSSSMETSLQDRSSSGCGITGLLDEISEDVFNFNCNAIGASDKHQLTSHSLVVEDHLGKMSNSNISNTGSLPLSVSNRPVARIGLESDQATLSRKESFAEVMEGYCITGLYPLSEMSTEVPQLNADFKCKLCDEGFDDVKCGDSAWYRHSSPRIVENYIPMVSEKPVKIPEVCEFSCINHKKPDELCSNAKGRIVLKNIGVRWRMYAGSDWHDKDLQHTTNTSGRDTSTCLELTLSGMDMLYGIFPDGDVSVSKLSISVQDFHLYDCSINAPWKLVLGYYHSRDRPRESSAKAFKLELDAVRPDPSIPLEEYRLHVALLPVLLHLHQDQLDFLISFFGGRGSPIDQSPVPLHDPDGSKMLPMKNSDSSVLSVAEEALLPFFQKFDIRPFVVRVDYIPRHIDLAALRGGDYVHLVNLVSWKGVELQLKQVHAVGVYGWGSVCETIVGEWLEDISHNQIHKFLKGLRPIRSLFTVGSGAAKLVSLPVKNYRKDHRLIKGIQRGAMAFLRSISLEAVGLGVHLAAGAHDILLQTEYILTSIPPSVKAPARSKLEPNVRSNQPEDAQQGIQQAYESLSDGFSRTASALVGTPLKTYQRGAGAGSALATAVCAAPAAAIAPASAAMRALHCALLGVRNSLDPEHKKESMEKYMGSSQHPDCG